MTYRHRFFRHIPPQLYGAVAYKQMKKYSLIKYKEYQTRFNRWHDKQIEFTTVTINLVFTITIGLIGFLSSQKDERYNTILFFLAISTTIGFVLLILRIHSFKLSKNINKLRKKHVKTSFNKKILLKRRIIIAQCKSNCVDKMIYPFLLFQIVYLLGAVWLLIAVSNYRGAEKTVFFWLV